METTSRLNPQQLRAVTAPAGPVLVLAGPGSGKTAVLTERVAHLVQQGTPAHRIMAVTFTNKAAKQMRERIGVQLGVPLAGNWVGTFHATCARILRREADALPAATGLELTRDFAIYDTADQVALLKQASQHLNIDEKRFPPQRLLGAISRAKNEMVLAADFLPDSYLNEIVARVYVRYQQLLGENNAADFDDLLLHTAQLFQRVPAALERCQHQFEHVLVDEFQDTNLVQYRVVQLLSAIHDCLYVVGDPDQSIYSWRGADHRNVLRFEKDHPGAVVVLLEQNYRSTQNILDAAMAVIDRNPQRTRKQLFTERREGTPIVLHEAYDPADEAKWVLERIATLTAGGTPPGDCAIMYRTNAQSRALEDEFVRARLPYRLVGATRFYQRREVKDMLAYLRLVQNPRDSVSLMRVINTPPRGVGAKAIETLQQCASAAGSTPALVLLELGAEGDASPHQAALAGRAARALTDFGRLLVRWIAESQALALPKLINLITESSGYGAFINDGSVEGDERWANVLELRSVAADSPAESLTQFLQDVALVSEVDDLPEGSGGAPTLLTLHAAKGLEFGVVFLVGLEDGLLPHSRSLEDPTGMEEERRLMYVGLTRAKDRLLLSYTFRRNNFGEFSGSLPSRFLKDIPAALLEGRLPAREGERRHVALAASWASTPAEVRSTPTAVFQTGQRVSHPDFGAGVVIESKPMGGDEMTTVAFEKAGLRKIMARVGRLKALPA